MPNTSCLFLPSEKNKGYSARRRKDLLVVRYPFFRALRSSAPDGVSQDIQDGLRLEWPDGGWVHVRPSGTEPILRIVAEAQQKHRAEELADWVRSRVPSLE